MTIGLPALDTLHAKRSRLACLLHAKLAEPKYCPLSFAQQRLWFLHQMSPDSQAYNVSFAARLIGNLDVEAVRRSLDEIVGRHEILRTTFQTMNHQARQVIAPTGTCGFFTEDIGGIPEAQREETAAAWVAAEAQRPFDLSQGPLMRTGILRLNPRDHVLTVTMHHIVSDGWAVEIMRREFATLYEAYQAGRCSPLRPLPIQYADYAVWEYEWLQGGVLKEQLDYWRNQLAGVPVLEIPADYTRPVTARYRLGRIGVSLSQDLTRELRALSRRGGATLFMTLLAGLQLLLKKYAGQADIAVGTVSANRNRAETEELIGCFVNTLVLRTNLDGNPSFRELIARVRTVTLDAYSHHDWPLQRLVQELHPEQASGRTPLFQVMLALHNTQEQHLELPGLVLTQMPAEIVEAKFELALSLTVSDDGLTGELEYAANIIGAETMKRLVSHYKRLLHNVAASPDTPVSEFALIGEPEREQVVEGWNRTEVEYKNPHATVQSWFEAQVEQTPQEVGLADEGQELSYEELNGRANQLPHYLRRQGEGPEGRVGVCVERSLEMVMGLLPVLKASGAYLPLD